MRVLGIISLLAGMCFARGSRTRISKIFDLEENSNFPLIYESELVQSALGVLKQLQNSEDVAGSSTFGPLAAILLTFSTAPALNRVNSRIRSRLGADALARMSACPLGQFLPDCPLTGPSSDGSVKKEKEPPTSIIDSASQLLEQAELQLMQSAGITQPFAATAIETALEVLIRATCEEIGSLAVSVSGNSSASLLLQGQVLAGRVEASNVVALGLRISLLELASYGLDIDIGNPIDVRPPNLRKPAKINFKVRWTQDDINRSPVLFGAFQAILRELIETGMSAAIQRSLPDGALKIQLVSVEALQEGRLVLVADAEATQADGSVIRLDGLRMRTRPRASSNMLVLDLPELISTFNGFGAKLEVGLPFLRAAGVPLPSGLSLTSVLIEDGAALCEGFIDVQPLDYDLALSQLQELAAAAAAASDQASAPNAVPVDREDADVIDVEASTGDNDVFLPTSRS